METRRKQPIEVQRDLERLGIDPDLLRKTLMEVQILRNGMSRRQNSQKVSKKTQAMALMIHTLKMKKHLTDVSIRDFKRTAADLTRIPF